MLKILCRASFSSVFLLDVSFYLVCVVVPVPFGL